MYDIYIYVFRLDAMYFIVLYIYTYIPYVVY